jgi:SAM-dependent methyltransferase
MDNSEQIEYWNSGAGEVWVAAQQQMDAMLGPLSMALVAKANVQPGERAIDIGCGCGDTSIALAQQGASVWGVDISEPMLDIAKQRATGLGSVAFSQTDAATQSYTPDHDLVLSRFGVMFFADPIAAFTQIRTALSDSGRMVFLCWQAPKHNDWMSVVGRAVQPFMPAVGAPDNPKGPGPFAFADADWLREILVSAEFNEIEIEPLKRELTLGRNLDEAILFQGKVGPLARGLAELDEATKKQALGAAREALTPYLSEAGVRLGAACWLVSARRS